MSAAPNVEELRAECDRTFAAGDMLAFTKANARLLNAMRGVDPRWRVAQTGPTPMTAPLRTTVAHMNGDDGYPLCGKRPARWRYSQFDAYPDDKRCAKCAKLAGV